MAEVLLQAERLCAWYGAAQILFGQQAACDQVAHQRGRRARVARALLSGARPN